MDSFRSLNMACLTLVILGGVDLGLVSIFGFDPLAPILGGYNSAALKIIYGAVGLSALWVFYAYMMTPSGYGYKEK
jgi:uncharacterized membrane protein YuzA (DUF378 family)